MRRLLVLISLITCLNVQAASGCKINNFLKSTEGQEKLVSLVERSKALALSKLEEISIEENQVVFKAMYPKSNKEIQASFFIQIKAKNLQVEGTSFLISKVIRDEDCGIEITITNGKLLNRDNSKDFGSLGKVKEFVRLN